MTTPTLPPALLALQQAIDEALLNLSGKICELRIRDEGLEEVILPPEFYAAKKEADAQRMVWKEQWNSVIAPALIGAGMVPDRIEQMRRSILRALDGVAEEKTWAVVENDHV